MNLTCQLELWFERHGKQSVWLQRTSFHRSDRKKPLKATRGAYTGNFKWSSGVKSLMLLLVRSVAVSLRAQMSENGSASRLYFLQGGRPSPAASLNDVLTKRPHWIYDIFGTAEGELPLLENLILRQNRDFFAPEDDVSLWLNPELFAAGQIEIYLNGEKVNSLETLETLADEIESQFASAPDFSQDDDLTVHRERLVESYRHLKGQSLPEHAEVALELCREDVELTLLGLPELGLCGRWQGIEEVAETVKSGLERLAEIQIDVQTILADENVIVVMGNAQKQAAHQQSVCQAEFVHKFNFEDGRIARAMQIAAWAPASM